MSNVPHPFIPLMMETLASTAATHVVCLGKLPWPDHAPACTWLDREAVLEGITGLARADLALACLAPDENPHAARQQIAALRDLLARQSLVFVPEKLLDGTALLGLGLTRQARYEHEGVKWQAWSYDIRTYKSVPDWLNPRFWANPENWNKYRW